MPHTTGIRGFVVRSVDYGDSDRILTLYTCELGKISARARAARKSRKRYQGALEPFVLVEATLEKGRGEMWHVKEATAAEVFSTLGTRLDLYNAASHLLEFIREIVPEHEVDPRLFDIAHRALKAISQATPPRLLHLLFHTQLKMLSHAGLGLNTSQCNLCKTPAPKGRPAYIDYEKGGIVCSKCGGGPLLISKQVASALQQLNQPQLDIESLEPIDDTTAHDLFGLITHFAEHSFGCRIRTTPF